MTFQKARLRQKESPRVGQIYGFSLLSFPIAPMVRPRHFDGKSVDGPKVFCPQVVSLACHSETFSLRNPGFLLDFTRCSFKRLSPSINAGAPRTMSGAKICFWRSRPQLVDAIFGLRNQIATKMTRGRRILARRGTRIARVKRLQSSFRSPTVGACDPASRQGRREPPDAHSL